MTDTSRCSACGTPLPAGSESDRCPRCAAEADATDLLSTAPRFGTASRGEFEWRGWVAVMGNEVSLKSQLKSRWGHTTARICVAIFIVTRITLK